jgi:hypothetical protein
MLPEEFKNEVVGLVLNLEVVLSKSTRLDQVTQLAIENHWETETNMGCTLFRIPAKTRTTWEHYFPFWDFYNTTRDFYYKNKFKYFSLALFHIADFSLFKRKLDFNIAYYELETALEEELGPAYKKGEIEYDEFYLNYSYWKRDKLIVGIQQSNNDPQFPIGTEVIFQPLEDFVEIPVDIIFDYSRVPDDQK